MDEVIYAFDGSIPRVEFMGKLIRCNKCKHYDGVPRVPGVAPCTFWEVMVTSDDYCSQAEEIEVK